MTDHLDPAELAALPVHERLERIRESIRAKVAAAPAVDHNGRPLPARATAEEARADAEQIKAAAGPEAAGRYLRAIGHEALAGQLDPQPGPGDGGPRDPVPHRGRPRVE